MKRVFINVFLLLTASAVQIAGAFCSIYIALGIRGGKSAILVLIFFMILLPTPITVWTWWHDAIRDRKKGRRARRIMRSPIIFSTVVGVTMVVAAALYFLGKSDWMYSSLAHLAITFAISGVIAFGLSAKLLSISNEEVVQMGKYRHGH